MDISISGVKGYEFQYKATLSITLQLLKKKHEVSVFVEPTNGEDFLIIINENKIETRIEVQVKRESTKLNDVKLNEWLCHFESHSSDNCLLSRLINSDNYVLFITRSRCLDSTSFLIQKNDDIAIHENFNPDKIHHQNFHSGLKNSSFFSSTKLGDKRNKFCNKLSEKIEKKIDFEKIFKKIFILENLSDESLDSQIISLLNSKFQISHSRLNEVYLLLLDSIKKARDLRNDLTADVREILIKNKVNTPKLNTDYICRGIEDDLIKNIDKEKILLLTGISLCGKTEIAKLIACHYVEKGYNYNIASDFLIAEAFFFSTNPNEDKILILEDPFGHIELKNEVANHKLKLEHLLDNLHDNHKLIVTSRKEIVEDLYRDFSIIVFKKFDWQDLTLKNQFEAIEFWDKISDLKNYSQEVINKINSVIKLNDNLKTLQIGQIQYLSKFDKKEILTKGKAELETIARQNSNDIAIEIFRKDNDLAMFLSILSFCGSTISSIPIIDLEYIFSKDKTKYTLVKSRLHSLKDEKLFTFKYIKRDRLGKSEKKLLTALQERGFIVEKSKSILFSHPNYYESGRYVFKNFKKSNQNVFLQYLLKAIACNNEEISFFSTQQLPFLYANSIDTEIKEKIVKIAFKSLLSIFPSVIDNCLIFLLSIIEDLKEKHKSSIIHATAHNNVSVYNLDWHDDTPFETHNPRIMLERNTYSLTMHEVLDIEQRFLENKSVTVKKAWYLLLYYERNNKIIIKEIYEKLMLYNVSFIRAKACYIFFKSSIEKNVVKELIASSFKDEHPSVVFNCLRGSFQAWKNYSLENKSLIKPLLVSSLKRKDISIRASSLMTTFGIEYATEGIKLDELNSEETIEIWELWSYLFKIFQKTVPPIINIHTPRFIATLQDAMNYLSSQNYIEILDCWYDSILLKMEKRGGLDGFEFSIAKHLLDSTKEDHLLRKKLFDKLISFNDTSFLLSSLRYFIADWSVLSGYEKEQVIQLLKGKREDKRWIKAVILTSYNIPAELIENILGDKEYFKGNVGDIVKNFDPQLLEDCLSVYCGHPYQLSDLSTRHENFTLWQSITNYILENNHLIGYKTCLTEFLFDGVNGFREPAKSLKLWQKICTNSKEKLIETEQLIYATASCCCNIDSAKELWSILIKSYKSENRKAEIINTIKKNIIILQHSEREGIFELIDNKILFKILNETYPDNKFIITISNLKEIPDEADQNLLLEFIQNASSVPFKFYNTLGFAKRISEKLKISDELKEKLKSIPNSIYEMGKPIMEELNDNYNYVLKDWIYYKNN